MMPIDQPWRKETIETWNTVAESYSEKFMDMRYYCASYDFFGSALSKPDASVLEVGCGPGVISHYLLQHMPKLKWLGTDPAIRMIELARKNVPQAEFRQMDARHMTKLQNSFEGVVSGFCIPYLAPEETISFIKDAASILTPNGILYLSYVPGSDEKSGYKTSKGGQRAFFHYYTPEFIYEQLLQAGFVLLNCAEINYPLENNEFEMHFALIARKS